MQKSQKIGVALLAALARHDGRWPGAPRTRQIACVLLAAAWLWVGIGFHAQRFATLNAAAPVYAAVWVMQSAVLLALALGLQVDGAPAPGTNRSAAPTAPR